MLSLPELLRRFRRVWAPPGPALARVAPPVDVGAGLRREVQPLLDAIAEIQQRARAVEDEADGKARQLLDSASADAERIVREAENRAPQARSDAAGKQRHAVDAEIESAHSTSQDEAKRIEAQLGDRLPALLAKVQDCVLKAAGAPT